MADLVYHAFAFVALFSHGLYHLISATRAHLAVPSSSFSTSGRGAAVAADHTARPYYPLALAAHRHHLLRHLPLYLALLCLLVAVAVHAFFSSPDGARAAAQRFSYLESAAALFLFVLLAASILILPLPADVVFLLAALAFALLSAASAHSAAAYQQSELQSKCDSISSLVFAASATSALVVAIAPRLFVAELALAASIALQGLWSFQTGISLYVDAFIPEGCHQILGVRDISTNCDLDSSLHRAAALLDLAFALHATLIAITTSIVCATSTRAYSSSGLVRRHDGDSYEALPASLSTGTLSDMDHIQMKAFSKSSTQA
ncbi:unnamed protein product [Musa acuminata subsp. burmannicoides]